LASTEKIKVGRNRNHQTQKIQPNKINQDKLTLVTSYGIQPINRAGLFSKEEIKKEVNKKEKYKQEKKEAS